MCVSEIKRGRWTSIKKYTQGNMEAFDKKTLFINSISHFFSKWPFLHPLGQLSHCPTQYMLLPDFLPPAPPCLPSIRATHSAQGLFSTWKCSPLKSPFSNHLQWRPGWGDMVMVDRLLLNPALWFHDMELGDKDSATAEPGLDLCLCPWPAG